MTLTPVQPLAAGLSCRYFDPETVGLDFDGMFEDLNNAPEGSVVVLHGAARAVGCCIDLLDPACTTPACAPRQLQNVAGVLHDPLGCARAACSALQTAATVCTHATAAADKMTLCSSA